jgi:KipI family sensor histidine kinase inhibitor
MREKGGKAEARTGGKEGPRATDSAPAAWQGAPANEPKRAPEDAPDGAPAAQALGAAEIGDGQARFLASGDTALVVELGDGIDARVSALVLALAQRVAAAAIAGVIEVVPTFRSLMVHYDPLRVTRAELEHAVAPLLTRLEPSPQPGRRFRIPVCYDESVGLDLATVAARTGLTVPELVARHTATEFRVYMTGFLPGFPYLGGLPRELCLPRRDTPRLTVPRGSVAIAMDMTCIYSLESPGGWHVLGRTPVQLFDLDRDPPALLAAGDTVCFAAISLAEYQRLASAAGVALREATP